MKKHRSEEAFHQRMRDLAGVDKISLKESKNYTLGTLIDFERATNGVAYGIIKEQHKYYIKKGGLNENLSVADFAYIGGLGNVTDFQYKKLGEAKKQRNMLLKTVNEGVTTKVSKTGSKKKILTEDKAGKEIEIAASKVGDLDAATTAAEIPPEPVAPDAEMDAGLKTIDDAPVGDVPVDGAPVGDVPVDGAPVDGAPVGDVPVDGSEELPIDGAPIDGSEELPVDGIEGDEEVAIEDPQSEATREIEKSLGKLTNTLRKTELTEPQVKSYVNSFLSAFKDDFPEIDIEDRKAMAEKITKVVPPEDIEDLGQNVEDTEEVDIDNLDVGAEPELEMAEQQCAECGGFAKYADSRGYTAESIQKCNEEEMTNLLSGYANAHNEGQNDGDFKAIALFITPEIIEKLKGEYGHDDFADQVEPFSTEMNETTIEEKQAQITELFGGLRGAAQSIGKGIGGAAQQVGQAVQQKAQQVGQAVQQGATNVKQAYHTGELPSEVKKLEKAAANLGAQIGSLSKRMQKAGGQPINLQSILTTIKNQVGGGSGVDLSKFSDVQENDIPVDHTEVQPMMGDGLEEDVEIKVSEKEGKKLSADNTPEVEMKEGIEDKGEDVDIDTLDVNAEETPTENNGEEEVLDLTKRKEPELKMQTGFDSMGGGVVKPDGAATVQVEVDAEENKVNVTMNESEVKLRKYIRNRLEEHAGVKKPNLNENKKSKALQKLDRIINKQFNLYELEAKKK